MRDKQPLHRSVSEGGKGPSGLRFVSERFLDKGDSEFACRVLVRLYLRRPPGTIRGVRYQDSFQARYDLLKISSRFPASSFSRSMTPVMFPPGRRILWTSPCSTGLSAPAKTIGMRAVAACAA